MFVENQRRCQFGSNTWTTYGEFYGCRGGDCCFMYNQAAQWLWVRCNGLRKGFFKLVKIQYERHLKIVSELYLDSLWVVQWLRAMGLVLRK